GLPGFFFHWALLWIYGVRTLTDLDGD
ncbi:MAG: hypothetical protein ACI9Y1_003187, partial [Lentisphaeria bacterium]